MRLAPGHAFFDAPYDPYNVVEWASAYHLLTMLGAAPSVN